MKTFKKLATLSMALMLVLGLGALTACNGDDSSSASSNSTASQSETSSVASASTEDSSETDSSSEETKTYTCYEFTVLDKDGNKVGEGYKVNLCTADMTMCHMPVDVVNGVCVYQVPTITAPVELVAHVIDANTSEEYELVEKVVTGAEAFGAYTLQLTGNIVEAE